GTGVIAVIAGLISGAVLTPLLLPWLPGRAFSLKGGLTGAVVSIGILVFFSGWLGIMNSLAMLLAISAVSSYTAMNFTGSTTFTSPSGVEKEMRRAIPFQLGGIALAAIAWFGAAF
ncbi:MAG TPA: mercury methylation corrinoid protein HgcA, partial [Desulfuromonadales bacterium]|nr:mercury methylation corrinoid protein HgcA [Desulfuromonadales bacterium]